MKKILGLIVSVAATLVIMMSVTASAQQVAVTRAEFPVIVNGRVVNNAMREYPFILYNSITYFPMTYEDCAFLGLENNWSAEGGNVITKTASSGYYRDFLSPKLNEVESSSVAQVVTTPITVMGNVVNNSAEQYPILNHKNILYFPLTWDWSEKFGWKTTFGDNRFLEVATSEFADAGYYYRYHKGNGIEQSKHPIAQAVASDVANFLSSSYSFSPNYSGSHTGAFGHTLLFRLIEDDDNCQKYIEVGAELLSAFKQNGWYGVDEVDRAVADYAKTHTAYEIRRACYQLPFIQVGDSALYRLVESESYKYESLYSSDSRKCAVLKENIGAYTSAGWLSGEAYIDVYLNNCVKRGDYLSAVEFLELNMGSSNLIRQNEKVVYVEDTDYDKLQQKYDDITQKLMSKMKKAVEYRATYRNTDDNCLYIAFNCAVPAGKFIKSFDVTYSLLDASGKIINTVSETAEAYAGGWSNKKSYRMAEVFVPNWMYPTAVGVKNVKVSNIVIEDDNMLPGGQG